MNVECPHCSTVFRVDPARIAAEGVRARCSICRGVFEVRAGAETEAATPHARRAETDAPDVQPPEPAPAPEPAAEPAPTPAPSAPTSAPAPAPPPGRPAAPSPFGADDPDAKARRLARALVSDIVTYHPERRDRALEEGTLKREFMEEIKKSWEEYVEQVGAQTARSTTHFRDALNDLLAKGRSVF